MYTLLMSMYFVKEQQFSSFREKKEPPQIDKSWVEKGGINAHQNNTAKDYF